ncbi:MAG: SDR family oxidoreductase [Verrucomicrobiota bacterium]
MPGKNYLIVGGSKGIGLSLVKKLTEAGDNSLVLSRSDDGISNLAGVSHLTVDVVSEEISSEQLPEVLHGVAYCPGSINLKPFRGLKPSDFQADFEINILGAVKTIQAALSPLKKSENGSVVLFSTVAVSQGMPYHASVATAKGGIEGLSRALAAELAPQIRVNCIAPSLTDTPLASRILSSPEKREAADKRHPLRRIGTPEDVASMAFFLLSDEASWVSGQTIGVDGGLASIQS